MNARRAPAFLPCAVGLVSLAAGLVLTGCAVPNGPGASTSPSSGATPGATPTGTSVYDLAVGDCFTADLSALLEFVRPQSCAAPHQYEVYASLLEPVGEFPGADVIKRDAQTRCTSSFGDFVGIRYGDSRLAINFLSPTRADWQAGNRSVLCFLSEPGALLTGSARQTAK